MAPRPGTRRLVYTPIDQLLPATANPKQHVDLDGSFDQFGYMEPVMLDERTGRLIGGHGRLESLQAREAAGKPPPEGITVRAGRWCVPVVRGWSSRDDAHAEAALVGLNRYTELGGWDDLGLAELLVRIRDDDAGADLLAAIDVDDSDLQKLFDSLPDFDPDAGDQGRLDRREITPPDQRPAITHECPKCHHTWTTR